MTIKDIIKEKQKNLIDTFGEVSYCKDFVDNYSLENIRYFCDAFCEFSNSCISVYGYDQKQYYFNHSEECDDALLELYAPDNLANIIKDGGLEALICTAGVCGEFRAIEDELYCNEVSVIMFLALDYLLRVENIDNLPIAKINEVMEYIDGLTYKDEAEDVVMSIDEIISEED